MAKQVEWTNRALIDRFQILSYWNNRNKSNYYSTKLDNLFISTLKALCSFPFTGKQTERENIRIKVIRNYLLVYKITDRKIIVLRVWDSNRDPKNLKY